MDEEPTLPKLPSVSWDQETQSFANTRKRARDQSLPPPPIFTNSSDPAIFSSDDDPQLENYTQGRHRKKRYVGSWFQQHPASSDSTFSEAPQPLPKAKSQRTFKRQFDSGVWMGSDISIDTEDDQDQDIKTPAESKLPQLRHARPVMSIPPGEAVAREVVGKAIYDGTPTVDLSSSGIEGVSNGTISRLQIFETIPHIDERSPFESKDPSIELYLSNNPLLRVPGALFNLEHLTVLSLRNTQITELPPGIGKLCNLQSLNLSLTRLRYLPIELLDLLKAPSKLKQLIISPNPFYKPDQHHRERDNLPIYLHDIQYRPVEEKFISNDYYYTWLNKSDGLPIPPVTPNLESYSSLPYPPWSAHIFARSPVQFNDSRGVAISKFQLPQWRLTGTHNRLSDEDTTNVLETEDLRSPPALWLAKTRKETELGSQSRVPSLFELALQACTQSGQLDELPYCLPLDASPHITRILERVGEQSEENGNDGNLSCSICGRQVASPMTQWIEWHTIGGLPASSATGKKSNFGELMKDIHVDHLFPFLRRGCSWKCVPQAMLAGQRYPGTMETCKDKKLEEFDVQECGCQACSSWSTQGFES
ncbi:hypothetical protein M426DRAFT_15907 [Hypoxylon sp. CI-4A]|nr:hypothetical protein M426DRAFT_15907 [Hypoxylon sp. CI-4A]